MTRDFLRIVARLLIGVVFAAQWAVAAYACPALATGGMPAAAVVGAAQSEAGAVPPGGAMAQSADCVDMAGALDPASPNLCMAHCQQGEQSDQAASLVVPTALLTVRYALRPLNETAAVPHAVVRAPDVRVAAFPPHAILHCVFRI